ncbi:hypothetical protein AB0F81_21135 [Actinoplanes sp. NPDC024001]|uniref:hypothetical protein n=1 Tax=Actinoplanes sp. NPDC024001 TaxID=3154598 RepID=UPI0033DD1878
MGLIRRIARARLAARVIRRLRRAGVTDARYHSRAFEIRFTAPGDAEPSILQLEPLLAKRPRRQAVDDFVAGLLRTPGLPEAWAEAAPLLRPVLRGVAPGAPLRRPAWPFLSEFVVVDQPDTMTYVTATQLSAWSVSADRVFARARANLPGAVLHGTANGPTVVRFVDDGDAYWTSHLLLEGWLGRLAEQVGGVPVAFAPERGTLLVAADGSDHLPGLFAQAEECFLSSARGLTPMAYVSDDDGCTVPYSAPPGHPLHHLVRRAERVLAVREYSRQAEDSPATFAPLTLVASERDGWRTRAVWERNAPTLLPEADEVQLGDRLVPWPELEPLLERSGEYPSRWSGRAWPEA